MLKLWSSGIGFVLQIALVVIGVLAFGYFDPLGFLNSTKQTLEDTPVSIKSIKDIGELITAEYYGEVLSSLREVYIEELSFDSDEEFKEDIRNLNTNFMDAMTEIKDSLVLKGFNKKGKLLDFFEATYPELSGHYYYRPYINYLIGKSYRKSNGQSVKANNERQLLKLLYDYPNNVAGLAVEDSFFSQLEAEKKSEYTNNKKEQKKQIVLLGRGWVKAGFKFGSFSEKNFKYLPDRNKIYFIGLQPEILNADINPWFIPERKIKGFEIILATKKVKRSPDELIKVKQSCLNKLLKQSMDRDILGKAQENAESHLKGLFSTLLDKEIENVSFVNDEFEYYLSAILDDGKIFDEELYVIDSALKRFSNLETKDSTKVYRFLDSLRNSPLEILDKSGYALNNYSSGMYHFAKDEVLDSAEYVELQGIRTVLALESDSSQVDLVWYRDLTPPKADSAKKHHYNQSLKILSNNVKRIFLSSTNVLEDSVALSRLKELTVD